jgi:purine-nucleoside phosphorylase
MLRRAGAEPPPERATQRGPGILALVSQLHVRCEAGAVAEYVLLPGDPNRARRIAERFFVDPVLFTDYRQMFGYTGTYRGLRVSVQATGMGCPSLAIVAEELVRLGARTLVRVGTAGIVAEGVEPGDLVVASGSIANDGTTRHYMRGQPFACVADHAVTRALVDAGRAAGTPPRVGLLQTDDAFYGTSRDDLPSLRAAGVIAIEMEASALFLLGALRGVRAGCAVVCSNRIGDDAFVPQATLDRGVDAMTRMTLDACVALAAGDAAHPKAAA